MGICGVGLRSGGSLERRFETSITEEQWNQCRLRLLPVDDRQSEQFCRLIDQVSPGGSRCRKGVGGRSVCWYAAYSEGLVSQRV